MTDWFEDWFGQEYLELYPHRDAAEAQRAVDLIRRVLDGRPVNRVLDLACGAGRHSRALVRLAWTTGLDLSGAMIRVAQSEVPEVPFVQGDMRGLPYRDAAFGLVVNLFTSFGYFENDAQHLRVISEVARVTRRGGTFVLDFLNADFVRATLVAEDETRVGERTMVQHRRLSSNGRYVEKQIELLPGGRKYFERVRLYNAEELETMLEECGFKVEMRFGNYDGAPYAAGSPRTIFFSTRE
jgi:SAM-dependent methyltransferase